MTSIDHWIQYFPTLGLTLDLRALAPALPDRSAPDLDRRLHRAIAAMADLESGSIANPTEGRRVGHYWLRNPDLAPDDHLRTAIAEQISAVNTFATGLVGGTIGPTGSDRFTDVVHIGIGGSALGPQFLLDALGDDLHGLRITFADNTDPDGLDRLIRRLGDRLRTTLVVVVSKSGSTRETVNALTVLKSAMESAGLDFASHAVSISCPNSKLDARAKSENWRARFHIWDFVGGRTSVTSAVGLLPAALARIDTTQFLAGAAACDDITRSPDITANPAAMLAAAWYLAGKGRGDRTMVVLPYRDRLALLARYLQQLVMESLGKGRDLNGQPTRQGMTVYGNKGTTDQHAFVQQLREGRNDFFVTFVRVLTDDSETARLDLDDGRTCADDLDAFLLGTRSALSAADRPSLTLTLDRLSAAALGTLVALFERTVGIYAQLINVNAYDQPGVEAGKKAATDILNLQSHLLQIMADQPDTFRTATQWAGALQPPADDHLVFDIVCRLAANSQYKVARRRAAFILDDQFARR